MERTEPVSFAEIRDLLIGCDDNSGHHLLWVEESGAIHLDRLDRGECPVVFARKLGSRMRFRLEMFPRGLGYTGPNAAADVEHVRHVCAVINAACRQNRTGFVDHVSF